MGTSILVLGGGPGGYVAALEAANLGAEVTLVEQHHLGGTCLNYGCIPSKIMKHAADLFHQTDTSSDYGVQVPGQTGFDMSVLMTRKKRVIRSQQAGIKSLLEKRGVTLVYGRGKIICSGQARVALAEGGNLDIQFDKLILATGTAPLSMPDFPFDHDAILSSDDLLSLNHVPKSIVIVGAGVIGCEFAFILSALGTQVTLVEGMSRVLPFPDMDADISKALLREMKKKKIRVICDAVVQSAGTSQPGSPGKPGQVDISLGPSPFTDNPKPRPLKQTRLSAERMGVCVGRSPNTRQIGLSGLDVDISAQGWITADTRMRTADANVFAIGDILGPEKVMLAHVASHEGLVAARNAMGHDEQMNYQAIPSAIFTMPEIGAVGLTQAQALQKGLDVRTEQVQFRNLGKAQAIGEISGIGKMVIENASGRILGVFLMGARATDLIAEAVICIRQGLTVEQVAATIHAHPTLAEIMGELSLKATGAAVHG